MSKQIKKFRIITVFGLVVGITTALLFGPAGIGGMILGMCYMAWVLSDE